MSGKDTAQTKTVAYSAPLSVIAVTIVSLQLIVYSISNTNNIPYYYYTANVIIIVIIFLLLVLHVYCVQYIEVTE